MPKLLATASDGVPRRAPKLHMGRTALLRAVRRSVKAAMPICKDCDCDFKSLRKLDELESRKASERAGTATQ